MVYSEVGMRVGAYIDHTNKYPYTIEFRKSPVNWGNIIIWCGETYGSPHGRRVHGARWIGDRGTVWLRFATLADAQWFIMRWS